MHAQDVGMCIHERRKGRINDATVNLRLPSLITLAISLHQDLLYLSISPSRAFLYIYSINISTNISTNISININSHQVTTLCTQGACYSPTLEACALLVSLNTCLGLLSRISNAHSRLHNPGLENFASEKNIRKSFHLISPINRSKMSHQIVC